jgi:hypothetical protein
MLANYLRGNGAEAAGTWAVSLMNIVVEALQVGSMDSAITLNTNLGTASTLT